jgi:hypothetical protein
MTFKWRGRLVNKNSSEVAYDWVSVETEHDVEALARNNTWIEFRKMGVPVPESTQQEWGWPLAVQVERLE